jgi:hypothetical protein
MKEVTVSFMSNQAFAGMVLSREILENGSQS